MTRDTADMFTDRERGRFGDNEHADEQPQRLKGGAKLHDITLTLRNDTKPLAIAVSDPSKPGAPWIWLPRSQIEIERKGNSVVIVTLPEWLATEKGLV